MSREIQSMHFGASKKQITFTPVFTIQKVQHKHVVQYQTPWSTYLKPVLNKVSIENKTIDTFHFFSDGAPFQYKQKGNFYMLSKEML